MHPLSLIYQTVFLILTTCVSVSYGQPKGETIQENADGRFTFGYKEQPLLFGYPHNFSSSHFILKAGNRQGSNAKGLYSIKHLQGKRRTKVKIIGLDTEKGAKRSETHFSFANLSVIQRLIPVNDQLEPVPLGEYGSFYRIEYEITNHASISVPVGLNLMLDAMIEGKDNCLATADGNIVMLDEIFSSVNVPEKVIFHKDHMDPTAPRGVLLTVPEQNDQKINALSVGQWAHLSNLFSLQTNEGVTQYTDDSAVMIEWKSIELPPKQTRRYVVYFGTNIKAPLNVQHYAPQDMEKLELFFDAGSSNLSPEAEQKIEQFVKDKYIRAVLLEGYADASGSEAINQQLAADRIASVSFKLQMSGVKFERILEKSHGEFFANEDLEDEQNARKVIITVWR